MWFFFLKNMRSDCCCRTNDGFPIKMSMWCVKFNAKTFEFTLNKSGKRLFLCSIRIFRWKIMPLFHSVSGHSLFRTSNLDVYAFKFCWLWFNICLCIIGMCIYVVPFYIIEQCTFTWGEGVHFHFSYRYHKPFMI